jgi:hypothetical protein
VLQTFAGGRPEVAVGPTLAWIRTASEVEVRPWRPRASARWRPRRHESPCG